MSPTIQKFLELERKKADWKAYLEELRQATNAVAAEVGIGNYFQDAEGTVYKIVVPEGRFVQFESVGYVRTRRGSEKRGDLSQKEAQEAGFTLSEQQAVPA